MTRKRRGRKENDLNGPRTKLRVEEKGKWFERSEDQAKSDERRNVNYIVASPKEWELAVEGLSRCDHVLSNCNMFKFCVRLNLPAGCLGYEFSLSQKV